MLMLLPLTACWISMLISSGSSGDAFFPPPGAGALLDFDQGLAIYTAFSSTRSQ